VGRAKNHAGPRREGESRTAQRVLQRVPQSGQGMTDYIDLLDKVTALQNLLVAQATGKGAEDRAYLPLRSQLLQDPIVGKLLPRFVRTCRDLGQFWDFIQPKFKHYAERREFIRTEFQTALDAAESRPSPGADTTKDVLSRLSSQSVQDAWHRALARQTDDPEGAITLARSLLETVCKHILDDASQAYPGDVDLPKLYHLVAKELQLHPSQHTEDAFKRILGGCASVVDGLGSLRNRIGDAHGTGRRAVRPHARHAALAVNLAGAMAAFIIATWEARGSTADASADDAGLS
jgi:hypothetical protein